MENFLVTYGFNKDREGIEVKWICDFCCLAIYIYLHSIMHSLPVVKIGNFTNSC